jgi:glycopeptide antibiotics resistance protein
LNSEATIYVGRPETIDVDFGMVTPTDAQVTFKSSNSRIAKVNDQGVVTPVNYAGYQNQTVTITGYVNAKPTLTDTLTLTIAKVFPTNVSIRVSGAVEAGRTMTITPTFTPLDVTDRQLNYTSSDPTLATVSSAGDFGVALGQSIGRVTITARSVMDSSLTATIELEIIPATILTPNLIAGIYLFVRKGIGHIGLNFINGFIGFITFYAFFSNRKYHYFYISVILGVALGFIFEGLQFFAPGRAPTFLDVIYNIFGYTFAQILLYSLLVVFKKSFINMKD